MMDVDVIVCGVHNCWSCSHVTLSIPNFLAIALLGFFLTARKTGFFRLKSLTSESSMSQSAVCRRSFLFFSSSSEKRRAQVSTSTSTSTQTKRKTKAKTRILDLKKHNIIVSLVCLLVSTLFSFTRRCYHQQIQE
jgi:hypothetical protein